jgi:SAM-dependent methyltransferase
VKSNSCIISCPLCNKEQSELLFKKGTKLFPVNVSICKNCGFVFLNPRWSEERVKFYYRYEYDLFHRPLPLKHKIEGYEDIHAKEVYERIFNNVELDEVKNILDVGAGNGEILNYFRQRLNSLENLYAIEPSIKCKRKIQENGGQIISKSIFDNLDFYKNNIDLIIIRHTLHLLYNPLKALEKIESLLTSKGVVYIAIPDVLHPKTEIAYLIAHLSYFSKYTLCFACNQVGLEDFVIKECIKNNELYGIFRKGDKVYEVPEIYEYQKLFICNKLKKGKMNLFRIKLKRLVASVIPTFVLRKILLVKRIYGNRL